jgi:DNA polymerase III delta prime subunit
VIKEYLLAWAALLHEGEPKLALANTVEVQSLSSRTIGLIVLPSHPLRVAWHAAYDNLVIHAAFEQRLSPKDIRDEFSALDGAMFPAFLPGLEPGRTFVFADTLGFHSVGMVADNDKEPKASIALLARALSETESADMVPTVGRQSAQILGQEILKYLECHNGSRFLQIHALRAGDGLTVARSLGHVQKRYRQVEEIETEDDKPQATPAFVLELYPSDEQRVIAGRFIAEAREKRRSGAGVLAEEDRWMLESLNLPGGMSLPRLRWARKEKEPKSAAHLAVAFDTFESQVAPDDSTESGKTRPLFAFGLLSFFDREYTSLPAPVWRSRVSEPTDGEKHPADRAHTDRLCRLQQVVQRCVGRNLGLEQGAFVLKTEISAEKADNLRHLHRLCDWVITLDRNAGIEYFDSPRDNSEIYEAYVIDCVPEREDLGCLQLITSTSNLEEVRRLLDAALDQMGLSRSRRNAEFLMGHLKALSGRLAIRLTGQKAPTSELIALALCHAQSRQAAESNACWPSLHSGFLIPVDDVQDLLPPVNATDLDVDESEVERAVRPDLIHISVVPRKGLLFRFIEMKYRRHLRDARSPDVLNTIRRQVESLHQRWYKWYSGEDVAPIFRAVRRAKLARVLRFYTEKARRHTDDERNEGLSPVAYQGIINEIDRMIEKASNYSFAEEESADRGWVFCPEYSGFKPLEVSPPEWGTKVFLFGPQQLPDNPSPLPHLEERTGTAPDVQPERSTPQHNGGIEVPSDRPRARGDAGDPSAQAAERTDAFDKFAEIGNVATAPEPEICLGTDPLTGRDVSWPLTVKGNPHLLVTGLPGMGKTTCLLNVCQQMVAAGVRPIVFSYHEDIDQRLSGLVSSVRFLDFHGLGFNPLEVIDRQSRLGHLDVAGNLRDIFTAIFPELGDVQGESIRNAIKQSFVEKGWDAPNADLQQFQEPVFKRFFEILQSSPRPDRGLRTLLARLEELADYGFFDLAESQDSLWDSDQPIVIRIHKTQNDVLQKAFAALVFYKLYKDMFCRGIQARITHAVIFDEAHRAARLTLIPTMAKECRKYGISLVLASQEARDFNISLFSTIANYLVLRLTELDAKALVRNVASSDQERAWIDKIKQMDRFKALYFCEGKKKPSLVSLLP